MKFYHTINSVILVALRCVQPHFGSVFVLEVMALFRCLTTPRKGLPDPQGSLAVSVPSYTHPSVQQLHIYLDDLMVLYCTQDVHQIHMLW